MRLASTPSIDQGNYRKRWRIGGAELCAALVLVLAFATTSSAGAIRLAWDASPSGNVAGYVVRYGTVLGLYTYSLDAGNATSATIRGLANGQPYYFVVQAYSSTGVLSTPTNAVLGSTTNTPPELSNPGPQSNPIGATVNLSVLATDAEADPILYTAAGLPPGLALDSATGAITGKPTATGLFKVTILANDGSLTRAVSFNWTVLPQICPCSIWSAATVPPAPIEEADFDSGGHGEN